MLRNKKGIAGLGLTAGATMLVSGVIILLIGIFIGQEVNQTVNVSLGAGSCNNVSDTTTCLYSTANATAGMSAAWAVYANVQSGFKIAGIALIVIGAVIILSMLSGFGG